MARDGALLGVELGEDIAHEFASRRGERDIDEAAVGLATAALDEPAPLKCGEYAGQRRLGEAAFGRDDPRLDAIPDPHDPEHDERRPGEIGRREHAALEVIAHRIGGPEEIGHHGHRLVVQSEVPEPIGHLPLGLGESVRTGHDEKCRRRLPGMLGKSFPAATDIWHHAR